MKIKRINEFFEQDTMSGLIDEFNSLPWTGLSGKIVAEADSINQDYLLSLNITSLDSESLEIMSAFIKKYDATIGINPQRGFDNLVIRIADF